MKSIIWPCTGFTVIYGLLREDLSYKKIFICLKNYIIYFFLSQQFKRTLPYNKTGDGLFGRNNGAANIDSGEVIEIVHLSYLAGLNSTMINTSRVLSHPPRLDSFGDHNRWSIIHVNDSTERRLNEIEEQRYSSSNSNSRFMIDQRCGNR